MKKLSLFLVLCLPVTIFVACNKSDDEQPADTISGTYVGETHGFHHS